MQIEGVKTVGDGDAISRRNFLAKLGIGSVAGLAALKNSGLSEGSVGLTGNFEPHPFQAVGGFVEKGKLLLPSGCGVSLGQYGNPIIDPAPIHGASLMQLNPKLIESEGLWRNIMRTKECPSEDAIANFVRDMRVYQVLLKDGDAYQQWDLSTPSFEPPVVKVDQSGLLEVNQGGISQVSKDNRFYLRLVYHEDVNRFDRGAVIAVFEQGAAPTESDPVLTAELDTPMLVSDDRWSLIRHGSAIAPDAVNGEFEAGVNLIRAGDNLWRYAYENGSFAAECRRHGNRPNEEWSQMGDPIFYQLKQQGLETLLVPEPNLGKTIDLRKLGISNMPAHAAGVILWTATDGVPMIQRKSLTHLQNNGGHVDIRGNVLRWTEAGKSPRDFQIVEARSKPLTDAGTFDLYAVELTGNIGSALPRSPVVHGVGQFDMVKAVRAARTQLRTS
jgi:hypothetical protein